MRSGGSRALTIVAPRGYPWAFNGPRRSAHRVRVRSYLPLNKLRANLDGLTLFSPLNTVGADLIHAFNRVPLNRKPFVIGFESHLPRVWGLQRSSYERLLYTSLLSERCRRIVAISRFAARNFRESLRTAPISDDARDVLAAKLEVRFPNLDVPAEMPERRAWDGKLVATFIGAHFGRKGGCVVARMAELAHQRGLPVHFEVVSALQVGGGIWTDPSREGFFARYLALLDLPNVTHRHSLPNAEVRSLLARSDVCLLPTFADTFGFSVLEAMAHGTPALATAQAALPEVIEDGVDGMLLEPARTPGQEGWIWRYARRGDAAFEQLFADEVERLALSGLERLVTLLDNAAEHSRMCVAAHRTARQRFGSEAAGLYWDRLYAEALDEPQGRRRASSEQPAQEQRCRRGIGRG